MEYQLAQWCDVQWNFADIDECAERIANCNGPDDVCINIRGGHKCETITCPKGFVKARAINHRNK